MQGCNEVDFYMNSAGSISGTNRKSSTCTLGCHKHSVQATDFGLGTSVSLILLVL